MAMIPPSSNQVMGLLGQAHPAVIETVEEERALLEELRHSEKDAKLAQKLGQLQPFMAVFLLPWLYSCWNAWAILHLLGPT